MRRPLEPLVLRSDLFHRPLEPLLVERVLHDAAFALGTQRLQGAAGEQAKD